MAVEREKSRREWMLLRMSTRDSVPLKGVIHGKDHVKTFEIHASQANSLT